LIENAVAILNQSSKHYHWMIRFCTLQRILQTLLKIVETSAVLYKIK